MERVIQVAKSLEIYYKEGLHVAIGEVEHHDGFGVLGQTELILAPHVSLHVDVGDEHIVGGTSEQPPNVLHVFEEVGVRCVHRKVWEGEIKVGGRPHYIYLISVTYCRDGINGHTNGLGSQSGMPAG